MTILSSKPSMVALIPARAGSRRIPGKNTKPLSGKPLMQYTIEAAQASGVFDEIVVSTNDPTAALIAHRHGVRLIIRPDAFATDDSPDIHWVREALADCLTYDPRPEAFAILRPTSPFRTAETIRRAWQQFQDQQPCDSLRAVQPVTEHPGKMWYWREPGQPMVPFLEAVTIEYGDLFRYPYPWHSSPTQTLPPVYVQNASLEIAWTRVVTETDTISGTRIMPFFTEGIQGFDVNTPADWDEAERICQTILPQPFMEYLG